MESIYRAVSLYTDAGIVGDGNPSPTGGMYAYCLTDAQDELLIADSGFILPRVARCPFPNVFCVPEYSGIENNLSELIALVKGLEVLPDEWKGTVYCDNKNALQRVFGNYKMDAVPERIRQMAREQSRRFKGRLKAVLLSGHPNKTELKNGVADTGRPVSKWNVHCDAACHAAKRAFLDGITAEGDCVCIDCLKLFEEHPQDTHAALPMRRVLCDGSRVCLR